jgi:hypothetical protein
VDSLRKAPATITHIDKFGIDVRVGLWLKVGRTIVTMADGGDPNVITPVKELTDSRGLIYVILDWITSQFAEAFFDRDSRFEPRRLWDFVDQVGRWRRGDRTTASVLRISSTFNIARTELKRFWQRVTADHEPGHANPPGSPDTSKDSSCFAEELATLSGEAQPTSATSDSDSRRSESREPTPSPSHSSTTQYRNDVADPTTKSAIKWMAASEACRWANENGYTISLSTMLRHRGEFRWRYGEGRVQYEVNFETFERWLWERRDKYMKLNSGRL